MQKNTEQGYREAAKLFETIRGYKDASVLTDTCVKKAEEARKEDIYQRALLCVKEQRNKNAQDLFDTIPDYKDAKAQSLACQHRIAEIQAKAEAERLEREHKAEAERRAEIKKKKQQKTIMILLIIVGLLAVAVFFVWTKVIQPKQQYDKAVELYKAGLYEQAIAAFESLEGYKDSAAQIEACKTGIKDQAYDAAMALYVAGDYDKAITAFESLEGYKDSEAQVEICRIAIRDIQYEAAQSLYDGEQYSEALSAFQALGTYKDSKERVAQCEIAIMDIKYQEAISLYNTEQYDKAITAFTALGNYKDALHYKQLAHIKKADSLFKANVLWGLSEAQKVDIKALTNEERDAFLKSLYTWANNCEKQEDYINAFKLYQLSKQNDYEKRMQECNKKYMETPRKLLNMESSSSNQAFKITKVMAIYQSGKVNFTVYYSASKKGVWYVWAHCTTSYGGAEGPRQYGNFAQGDSSFSFSLNVSEELNYDWGEALDYALGKNCKTDKWCIYLTDATNAEMCNWGNVDSFCIGYRPFFENISTDLYGNEH